MEITENFLPPGVFPMNLAVGVRYVGLKSFLSPKISTKSRIFPRKYPGFSENLCNILQNKPSICIEQKAEIQRERGRFWISAFKTLLERVGIDCQPHVHFLQFINQFYIVTRNDKQPLHCTIILFILMCHTVFCIAY